jgi:tetratricopeptide (TPR) repeat protein
MNSSGRKFALKLLLVVVIVQLLCDSGFAQREVGLERYINMNRNHFFILKSSDILDFRQTRNMTEEWNIARVKEPVDALRREESEKAVADLSAAIKIDTTSWELYYYRGIGFLQQSRVNDALSDFRRAEKLAPTVAEIYYEMGRAYHGLSWNWQVAKGYYDKAIKLDPLLVEAYFNKGSLSIYYHRGSAWEAEKLYKACIEINRNFPDGHVGLGVLAMRRGQKEEALALLDHAVSIDPSYFQTYFWRGVCNFSLKRLNKAVADFDRSFQLKQRPICLFMRGFVNIEKADYDQAFADMQKAVSLTADNKGKYTGVNTLLDRQSDLLAVAQYISLHGPEMPAHEFTTFKKSFGLLLSGHPTKGFEELQMTSMHRSASFYFLQGIDFEQLEMHDSAFHSYQRALALDNNIFEVQKKMGVYLAALNDWRGAYGHLTEMTRIQPNNFTTYRLRGTIKFQQKEYIGAIIDLSEYLKNDSTDDDALFLRSQARTAVGDYSGAKGDLIKVIDESPFANLLQNQLGHLEMNMGDTTAALAAFLESARLERNGKKVIKIAIGTPYYVDTHTELAKIYVFRKDWDKADAELDTVRMSVTANNFKVVAQVNFYRGRIDYGQGRYTKAADYFDESYKLDTSNFEAAYYLGKSCQQTGQKERARKIYQQIAGYRDAGELLKSMSKR